MNTVETALTEAEIEKLAYDPDNGTPKMKDPASVKNAPPKLQPQIVQFAKRLAVIESSLFVGISG